ncbi:PepSY-associated TM helix domain-containing protein [Marinomonas pollencensis]|uniref:Putative iron-regulated membrane protein n=1 Tax=Marinomonas pollencensis TaxID=491954 RepID=A0A3E0DKF5_9GAMM|nr:PepSY-associated TM helix domain-containing protein [Marinomonas pollencensis]REG83256.1 putative iron-regulated membrane protein [Marinomonas pollencensis]
MSTDNRLNKASQSNALLMLITRLHFYIGLFIGPFILVAALTGTLYILTPQIENALYKEALITDSTGPSRPLSAQIAAARESLNKDLTLFAVRPAPEHGDTTRVMFLDTTTASGARAVFIDPATLAVKGDMAVYGTSGILPFRMTLDFLHRQLLLGEFGRNYSELAASWLWIVAFGGLFLWYKGGKKNAADVATRTPYLKTRKNHSQLGLILFLGLFFFSATGLTWSKWAGGNISTVRQSLGWYTPSPNTQLANIDASKNTDELFDQVLATARNAGIDAHKIEIKPPRKANTAWFVREIDRSWPTQVDSVAIDPTDMKVVSRADFASFPIVAKLIRWGVDFHMGVLFGVVNQILLVFFGLGLCTMVIWGYLMWWRRRPAPGATSKPLLEAWQKLSTPTKCTVLLVAIALGIALPAMGVSLVCLLIIDALRWKKATL